MKAKGQRKHMERRFVCPACHNADIIIHRRSLHEPTLYECPKCRAKFETQPDEREAA